MQELGEKLIALKGDELDALSLDKGLSKAVRQAAAIKSHGALRRQKQLIGKLMRQVDAECIRAALLQMGSREHQSKRVFAAAERWRDRLINDGADAMATFEAATGRADPTLRQLLCELDMTINERIETSLRRKIFRHVHTILVAQTEDG